MMLEAVVRVDPGRCAVMGLQQVLQRGWNWIYLWTLVRTTVWHHGKGGRWLGCVSPSIGRQPQSGFLSLWTLLAVVMAVSPPSVSVLPVKSFGPLAEKTLAAESTTSLFVLPHLLLFILLFWRGLRCRGVTPTSLSFLNVFRFTLAPNENEYYHDVLQITAV